MSARERLNAKTGSHPRFKRSGVVFWTLAPHANTLHDRYSALHKARYIRRLSYNTLNAVPQTARTSELSFDLQLLAVYQRLHRERGVVQAAGSIDLHVDLVFACFDDTKSLRLHRGLDKRSTLSLAASQGVVTSYITSRALCYSSIHLLLDFRST